MNTALAERLVACNHWKWDCGLHDREGRMFVEYTDCEEAQWLWVAEDGCEALPVEGKLPDTNDQSLVGWVLQLVRQAYDDQDIYMFPITDEESLTRWEVGLPLAWGRRQISEAATEIEALVLALENAP